MRLLPANATSRVVAAHLVLVALSTGLVLGFVWFSTVGQIEAEVRERVLAELGALAGEYQARGLIGAAGAIRARRPAARDTVYLLTDESGERIAGNLGDWPPTVRPGSGWAELHLYRTDRADASPILAASIVLPGGERLLVGHDKSARAAFDRTLWQALVWALAVMLVLALVTGWLLSRLVLGRIADVARTAREIRAGDLARRVPERGTGDEFDRLAAELNHMLARIESLVTDLRMVTDSLAHDLRSPLTRLRGRLEEAAAEAATPEARDAIARALAEGDRVLVICTALLDIARADAGVGREQFERLDLAALARDVAELFGPAAEEAELALDLDAPSPVWVAGHRQFLFQALGNLIENALAHAPPRSRITLEAAATPDGAVVAVADRGVGIPAAERARVTERFARLDASRSGGGAGLGLALVQAVARLHDGVLRLEDNGPGLRAELHLPLGETAEPAPAEPAERDDTSGAPARGGAVREM
ncbi:MAG TPA: HAMP domain-containing sensor histidine kinase [Thermohalobaculum sp.]|nr:HAMP domain-containing sensor histidine kinase [Thermohalobaculum sp.]